MPKKAKVRPAYMKAGKWTTLPLHRVVDVLQMIDERGHSKKFKRQAKAAAASIRLHAKTVNFVKDFVANNNMHDHPVGDQVNNSNGSYRCPPPKD